jgi:hypothetical protein
MNGALGRWGSGAAWGCLLLLSLLFAFPINAQTTRALIVSGVSGEPRLAQQFQRDATVLRDALTKRFGANTVVLTESSAPRSDKAGITAALQTLASSTKPGEQVLLVLIGHASAQGGEARFNIPGPDITAAELAIALEPLKGRNVAVVVGTSSSGAFLAPLQSAARWVVTATKSGAQNEEVVFAGHFAKALSEDVADINKDGGVSLSEAFEYTKQEVARFYQQNKRIATEQATLTGTGPEGFILRAASSKASDPAVAKLYAEREAIDKQLTALRARKSEMQAAAYESELEKLLVQLALKDRQIRAAEKN